jgi:tripeptide aminopeptidase
VPAEDGYTSELARELAADALERFLRYVRIDTQSDPTSESYPSTAKQLDLARLLVTELQELGLDDAELDEHGYVFATLPATTEREAPTIGFLAHVDTSPDVTGTGVEPQVVHYGGGRIELPGDPAQALDPEHQPALAAHVGHELVTSDGTTLLGADNKAGVAEIMAALAHLARHPEREHGRVRVAFTPDEEIGQGTRYFDLERFGASVAYTLDGPGAPELQAETWAALEATVEFRGRSEHPGTARGRLVNAVKLAADFVAHLPQGSLSPETTDGRDGFVHPNAIEGGVERCRVKLILRDFEEETLAGYEELVRRLADETVADRPEASAHVETRRQYRNMRDYLRDHPRAVAAAEEAIRREGLEPEDTSIRGGTDGSRLSERGLPTPNLFTGSYDAHSRHEWACVPEMGAAAATIVHLAEIWCRDGA